MVANPVVFESEAIPLQADASAGYRPDIDGLRAVAIFAVVAFHAGIRAFHGGFVGVDIFFVISGYLIGGIVYRETKSNTFTFAKFYQRRAKRILPALLTVLLFCYLAGILLLSPAELRQFVVTALASIFSVSNVNLLLTTGYFTNGSQFNPLLMTWSLAIEEQFYVLFPIAMLAVVDRKRDFALHAVAICSILSFGISVWAVAHHPSVAFFLLPSRAWELGVGVLLAILAYNQRTEGLPYSKRIVQVLGGLGAALLIYSILVCRDTQFPGVAALLPVIGTLLVIKARHSFVNDILSARPIIFVGKISYSWYLWHWPMLSFAKIASDRPLGTNVTIPIAVLSFFVAIVSYRYVEQPFRHSRTTAPRMLLRYGALLLVMSVPPLVLLGTNGLPQRWPKLAKMETQDARGETVTKDNCLVAYGKTTPHLIPGCIAAANEQHVVALIGDSHAAMLAATLRPIARKSGYAVDEIDKSSCPPLQNVGTYMPNHPGNDQECATFNISTLKYLLGDPRIEVVVIAGFWSGPFAVRDEDFKYVPVTGNRLDLSRYVPIRVDHSEISNDASRASLQSGLEYEVERLRASGKRVILMQDAPIYVFSPVRHEINSFIAARRHLANFLSSLGGVKIQGDSGRASPYDDTQEASILDHIAARYPDVRVYDLKTNLCGRHDCSFLSQGSLLYVDGNHLSRIGAEMALADLKFEAIGRSR